MDETLTVEQLAAVLQEPKIALLTKVLRTLGVDRTTAILTDTLQREAAGGMRTKDATRRRTPGGVFFQLVRQQASPQEQRRLFPHHAKPPPPKAPRPALTWDEVSLIIQTLATQPVGEARTMKVTLIGRPGKVDVRGQAVVFRMQGKPPGPLPRGLPPVPATPPMTWNVMVALRQWSRVKDSLAAHQDDQLIIEGYPLMQGDQHVLLAQSCVSMLQQRAQKQAPRVPAPGETPVADTATATAMEAGAGVPALAREERSIADTATATETATAGSALPEEPLAPSVSDTDTATVPETAAPTAADPAAAPETPPAPRGRRAASGTARRRTAPTRRT
jgi:hypothetical protein